MKNKTKEKREKTPWWRPNQRAHAGHGCDGSRLPGSSRCHTHTRTQKKLHRSNGEGTGLLACTMRYTTRHHAAQSRNGNGARAAVLTDGREQTVPGITRSTIQLSSASRRRGWTLIFSSVRGGQLLASRPSSGVPACPVVRGSSLVPVLDVPVRTAPT